MSDLKEFAEEDIDLNDSEQMEQYHQEAHKRLVAGLDRLNKKVDTMSSSNLKTVLKNIGLLSAANDLIYGVDNPITDEELQLIREIETFQGDYLGFSMIHQHLNKGESNE